MKLLGESRTGPGSRGHDEEDSLLIAFSKVLAIGIRQKNEMLCRVWWDRMTLKVLAKAVRKITDKMFG